MDRDELLQHYQQMREELLRAIDGLTDELMTEPSLDGWSVKDHLTHLALWDDLRAADVVRISAGHESACRMTRDQVDAYNTLGYDLRLAWTAEQARWELATSAQRLLEAISSTTARGLDASLYGVVGIYGKHEGEHTRWIKRWRSEKGV